MEDNMENMSNDIESMEAMHEKKCQECGHLENGSIFDDTKEQTFDIMETGDDFRFWLSSPVDQSSEDKSLYGVLPFVAPDILRGREFTKTADISLDICEGERPLVPEYTPEQMLI
ncbi:hypothetical protein C1645_829313 [Glomus cerebriforme]|uniref:Protein kinase domain-containing protein n=1 Tax=Glomus cerebriforme TaxID=658196 RepID=A0A397SNA7_9GLOM|nr:hypothetical protein C1645_829313 [Glomus cerebriforme]